MTNPYNEILNKIKIKYKINENDQEINIFGFKFVKNNENNGIIICVGKEYNLTEKFELKKLNKKNILE